MNYLNTYSGCDDLSISPIQDEYIYAVIHDGLSEGEVVISEGIVKARPGQAVNAVLKQEQE